MANKLTPELIEKAKQAKSAEELIALAKENGAQITEENAKAYFDKLNKAGELSDDELDNVAGGCGNNKEEKPSENTVTDGLLIQRPHKPPYSI